MSIETINSSQSLTKRIQDYILEGWTIIIGISGDSDNPYIVRAINYIYDKAIYVTGKSVYHTLIYLVVKLEEYHK